MQTKLWGFPLTDEVSQHMLNVLARVEQGEGSIKEDNRDMAKAVNRLINEGLQAFYHQPAHLLNLSGAMRATGDQSIKVVAGGMRLALNRFFSSLTRDELTTVAQYVRELIVERADQGQYFLMFPLEADFGEALVSSLAQAREAEVSKHDIRSLTHQLQAIVDLSMVYYYRKPADMVSLGKITRKTADTAIHSVNKAFHALLNRLIPNLSERSLARLADHLGTLTNAPLPETTV